MKDGRALVHTSPLREGMLINNETALRSVRSDKPLTQLYPRSTGETLIENSSPINVNGEHLYGLRCGRVIIRKRILSKTLLATLSPTVLSLLFLPIISRFSLNNLLIPVAALIMGFIAAIFLNRYILDVVLSIQEGTRAAANGDLRKTLEVKSGDELGQQAFEINKMIEALGRIMKSLRTLYEDIEKIGTEQVNATEEVAAAGETISAAVQQVAMGAKEQTTSMEAARSLAQGMNTHLEEMLVKNRQAEDLAKTTTEETKTASKSLNESIEQMHNIENIMSEAAGVMGELDQQSKKIGLIVEAITGIADQTNLLALNAAIEAARAGEQGRGFAVVANEVRKLAEGSSTAAKEIMVIISETQKKTREAAEAMERGNEQINIGTQYIEETGNCIQDVGEAVGLTEKQIINNMDTAKNICKMGVELLENVEIVLALSQEASEASESAAAFVEEQAASNEEVSAGANHLFHLTEKLEEIVGKFKLNH
ncbi:MAG: hypothetical protein GX318_04020 [Clostridia bacterium]|nr:hypothetical protein [Clostridia bacterium]